MATMSITSQNTICIRAQKRNIRIENIVNPSGNGSGMCRHQKNEQRVYSINNILVKKRTVEVIFPLFD
jgi:hypothetical protein